MKKSLIALAVLASATAAAQAQNVTLYGTIDASYAQRENGAIDTTFQGNGDYLGSSVLGIKGSEDLGKGLKASFQLEGDLNVNNGTGDASGGLTFDRHAWVGAGYKFATLKIGRVQDFGKTLSGYTFSANLFDPFAPSDLGVAGAGNIRPVMFSRQPNSTSLEGTVGPVDYAVTASNNINGGNTTNVAGAQDQIVYGASAKLGPANVGFAIGQRGNIDELVLTAKAKLFGAELGGAYFKGETDGVVGTASDLDAFQLSVKYGLGAGFAIEGNYYDGERDFNGTTANDVEGDFYGLMLTKAFSKRTSAYVGFREASTDTKNAAGVTTNSEETIYVVGLQHKF